MSFRNFILLGAGVIPAVANGSGPAPGTAQLPFMFVENVGQSQPDVRFVGNGPGFKTLFHARGITVRDGAAEGTIEFLGGNLNPEIVPCESMHASANFLLGGETGHSGHGLPIFSEVEYRNVWPGISIRFRASGGGARAEYVLAPYASVADIQLRFTGDARRLHAGRLAGVGFERGKLRAHQQNSSGETPISAEFQQLADGIVGVKVGNYDPSVPLTITSSSPLTASAPYQFSGYFGGSAQSTITAVAVNSSWQTIVAGWTLSADLPASSSRNSGGFDAFVAGFKPDGSLLFCL